MKIPRKFNEALLASADIDTAMITAAAEEASALVAAGAATPTEVSEVAEGARFRIPVLLPEDIESGDGRSFDPGSLDTRNLPVPLMWQIKTGSGHDGAVIVARIDSVEPIEGEITGLGNAYGVFDTGPYGREAERLVRGGFLRGVSADLDRFEASVSPATSEDGDELSSDDKIVNDKIRVNAARLMGATLVAKPAFQECVIELIDGDVEKDLPVEDGVYEEATDEVDAALAAIAASAAPVIPPRDWFGNPGLHAPTPITVTDDGRVFGHIAAWNVDHIGLPRATKPPRSKSNYAYFRTGVLRTDDGSDVPVGQLTLAGGHAPLNASANDAVKHYDDTASAIADVSAGEDQYGIWVAGSLRPEATPEQVRALRASAPSGDWRPINGRLELVAVCQVNVPGFPVARTMVAGGQMTALVAAGARPLAELRNSQVDDISTRLAELEALEFKRAREAAAARLAPMLSEYDTKAEAARQKLAALAADSDAELSTRAAEARARLVKGLNLED